VAMRSRTFFGPYRLYLRLRDAIWSKPDLDTCRIPSFDSNATNRLKGPKITREGTSVNSHFSWQLVVVCSVARAHLTAVKRSRHDLQ
jgi:hypothetical protein